EGSPRRGLGENVVEVVAVDGDDLAVLQGLERLLGLAGEVGENADDERQLKLLHRAAGLDVVGDLDARTAHAIEFVLRAFCHGGNPQETGIWMLGGETKPSEGTPKTTVPTIMGPAAEHCKGKYSGLPIRSERAAHPIFTQIRPPEVGEAGDRPPSISVPGD